MQFSPSLSLVLLVMAIGNARRIDGLDISVIAQRTIRGGYETEAFLQTGPGFDVRFSDAMNVFMEVRHVRGLSECPGTACAPFTTGERHRL
jgi:hypothetical protein